MSGGAKTSCIAWTAALLLLFGRAGAQSADVSADRQNILIGEPIRLTVTVRGNQPNLAFPDIPDSLPHFTVLSRSKIDSVGAHGDFELQQQIILTSFDSGIWIIPSFTLPNTNIVTDSLVVGVHYIPMSDHDPLKDIKDVIPVHVQLPWWLLIALGAAVVVLIGLLIWAIRTFRERAPARAEAKATLPPYEEAIQALEALKPPNASADLKPFYTNLDDILRRYCRRAFDWKAMQFTTTEMIMHLDDALGDPAMRSEAADVLRVGDAVKFAKYFPESSRQEAALGQVRKVIDSLHEKGKRS